MTLHMWACLNEFLHWSNSHDIQHRVVSQHLMWDVHNEVEPTISMLDTGWVSRPHLKPDGHTFINTVRYKQSPGCWTENQYANHYCKWCWYDSHASGNHRAGGKIPKLKNRFIQCETKQCGVQQFQLECNHRQSGWCKIPVFAENHNSIGVVVVSAH